MKLNKLAYCMLLTLPIGAYGNDANDENQELKTNDIVVTATRTSKALKDVPMSVGVVTEKEISKRSTNTIGSLLEDVPGVSLENDGTPGLVRVGIRGENAFRTLVLVDGQKVSEHSSMSGSPMLVAPSSVERIEVIKGPASVLYGSDALGGVVNIITKKQTDKSFGGDVSAGYNSGYQAAWTESAALYGSNNGFNFRLTGFYANAGNLITPNGTVDNTNSISRSGTLHLSYDFDEQASIGLNGEIFEGAFHTSSEVESGLDSFKVDIPLWDRKKINIYAKFLDLNDYCTNLRFDAYYQRTHKKMRNQMETSGIDLDIKASNYIETFGLSTLSEWQLGSSNYLIAGLNADFDNMHATKDNSVEGQMGRMYMNSNTVTRYNGYQNTYSAFLSNETTLPSDFAATYGVRYTFVESGLQNNDVNKTTAMTMNGVTSTTVKNTKGNTDRSVESKPVLNLGIVYSGFEDLALRANWSQGFRTPIIQEKYLSSSMGSTSTTEGNPDLDPETSNNYELGARYFGGNFDVNSALFYNKIKNFITTRQVSSNLYRYENVAQARTFGMEFDFDYTFDNGLKPYTSWNFIRRKYQALEYETYYTNLPEFTYRAGLNYNKDWDEWSIGADAYARGAGARKIDANRSSSGEFERAPGYTTANLAFNLAFGAQKQYTLNLAALNIFDKTYYVNDAIAEPGRHFEINMNAKF